MSPKQKMIKAETQEIIFALGLFAVLGLAAYVLRDTITIIQAATFFVLGVIWWFAMKQMHISVVGLVIWIALESVVIRFIPQESFLYVRFFPEILVYSMVARVLFDRFIRPLLVDRPQQPVSATHLGIGMFQRYDRLRSQLLILMAAFFFVGVVSMIFNGVDALIGVLGIRQIMRFALIGIVLVYMDIPQSFFDRAWKWLLALFGVEIAIGLLQYAAGGALDPYLIPSAVIEYGGQFSYGGVDQFWQLGTRLFATLGRYDRYGAWIGMFTTIVAGVGLSRMFSLRQYFPVLNERFRLYAILTTLGIICTFLSSSRAALLALAISLVWLMGVVWKKRAVLVMSGFGLLSLIIGAFVYAQTIGLDIRAVVDSPDATVFERLVEPLSQQSLQGNYDNFGRTFWIVEVPRLVVASSPVYGVGPGMFGSGTVAQFVNKEVYNRLGLPYGASGDIGVIDNSWFALWAEFGTAGLLLMMWILWTLYRLIGLIPSRPETRQLTQEQFHYNEYVLLASGAQAAVVYVTVVAFFANHFEFRTTMIVLWVVTLFLLRAKIKNSYE
jgi:hypothetical protein